MQAIIMAAGRGTRLGALTEDKPKAFLEINGHRLIDYQLAMLFANGIHNIKIVTGYRYEKYEELAAKYSEISCIYNPFYEMCNVLGSFYVAEGYLSNDDTVYLHADTIVDIEIFDKMLKEGGDIVLPVDFGATDDEAMKVQTINGRVAKISKQIPLKDAEGEFIGIAKLSSRAMPEIKRAAKNLMQKGALKDYFESAIQEVIDNGGYDIRAISTEKRFWGEVDFLEDYEYVKNNLPATLKNLGENLGHL